MIAFCTHKFTKTSPVKGASRHFFFAFFFYSRSNSSILLENLRTFIRNPSAFSSFLPRFPPRHSTPTGERSPLLHPSFFAFRLAYARITRTPLFSTFAFTPSPTLGNSIMHKLLRVKVTPPFFLHPVLHPPHRSHPRDARGRNDRKRVKTGREVKPSPTTRSVSND